MKHGPLIFAASLILLFRVTEGRAEGAGETAHYLRMGESWFRSTEGRRIADNILSHQSAAGGWPKNMNVTARLYEGETAELRGTFDNGATTDELRFLARAYNATEEAKYHVAFLKGLDHILEAQYPTGGWPQYYPPGKKYHRYITFNDHAMVRLMVFLREVSQSDLYSMVDDRRRRASDEAFERGVQCILRCQVSINGRLTAWCAQHDEQTLDPRPGRSYELVSLSSDESVAIVRLLMSLEAPSPQVVRSIEAAVAWLQSAKLTGWRVERRTDARLPKGYDTVLVDDPTADPLWARFYDIQTDAPIFADRDGVAHHRFSDISYEGRKHYAWLGHWPRKLLEEEYPRWKDRHKDSVIAPGPGTRVGSGSDP